MRKQFKYGVIQYNGAKAGDIVRFVEAPAPGKTGAILPARASYEMNAVIVKVDGSLGYVELKPRLPSATALAESGSAGGVRVSVPISAGGSLKIS